MIGLHMRILSVFSGRQCMAFYFKGDQLFAKRADVAESDTDDWTSFLMDLREPMEMPDLEDFSKFLATSMVCISSGLDHAGSR